MKRKLGILFLGILLLVCVFVACDTLSVWEKALLNELDGYVQALDESQAVDMDMTVTVSANGQSESIYTHIIVVADGDEYLYVSGGGISLTAYYTQGYFYKIENGIENTEKINAEDFPDEYGVAIIDLNKISISGTSVRKAKDGINNKYTVSIRNINLDELIGSVVGDLGGLGLGFGNFKMDAWVNSQTKQLKRIECIADLSIESITCEIKIAIEINAVNDDVVLDIPDRVYELIGWSEIEGENRVFIANQNTIWGLTEYGKTLEHIEIPKTINGYAIQHIGYAAFQNNWLSPNTTTKSIIIPDTVLSIGNSAFTYCTALGEIVIPSSVEYISPSAFSGCENLTVIMEGDIPPYIGGAAFGLLNPRLNSGSWASVKNIIVSPSALSAYRAEWTEYIKIICTTETVGQEFVIIDGVLVGYWGSDIDVALPDNITAIGSYTFQGFDLRSITIPKSVKSIDEYAFQDSNLVTIIFESGSKLTSIGERAFSGCRNLREIILPQGLTVIDDSAFYFCLNLAGVTIPDSVTTIGEQAFLQTRLTSVTIPANVTTIGRSAFALSGLESSGFTVYMAGVTPPAQDSVFFTPELKMIIVPKAAVSAYKAAWPQYSAFITDSDIFVKKFLISDNVLVRYIGNESLIVIPDGVTSIAYDALSFYGDKQNLLSITIPSSVTALGQWFFGGFTNLVVIIESTVPFEQDESFSSINYLYPVKAIIVPQSAVNAYKSAWAQYAGRIQSNE